MGYEIMIVKMKRKTADWKKKTDPAEMIMRAVWVEPLMLRTTRIIIYATTDDPYDNILYRSNARTHLLHFYGSLASHSFHMIRMIFDS